MNLKQKILNFLIPQVAYIFIILIGKTLKIKFIGNEEVKKNKNFIYALWHSRQFVLVYFYRRKNITVMTSLSQDGEYQTRILKKLGYNVVRVDSKNEIKGLRELIKLGLQNKDCVFAVDGPLGPIYKVKPGVFYIAQKTEGVIIPITASSKRAKIFHKAWDKYFLPYPFSKSIIIIGNPIIVSKEENIELKTQELKQTLDAITKTADEMVKK